MPALVAALLLFVPLVATPLRAADPDGELRELRVLETVEAHLAADGQAEDARLHTRLDARGSGRVEVVDETAVRGVREAGRLRGPTVSDDRVVWDLDLTDETATRRTVADYPVEELPLVVRVRYLLDGRAVSAEELRGASGEAVVRVQLRNLTVTSTTVLAGPEGGRRPETVEVAWPLLAEARLAFDPSWGRLEADGGRLGADADGATVHWSPALFAPFGSPTADLEVRAEVDGAALPRLEVEATPITAATSDLLATAEDLLTDRATVDAVGAFLAAALTEALGGAADGAGQLAGGLGELEGEIDRAAAEFDDLDPEALSVDALAPLADALDAVDPAALPPLDPLDPAALERLVDELLDPAELLAALDPARVLADADLGALLEALLAQAAPQLADLDLDEELVAAAVEDALARLGEQVDLGELLSAIDVAALLASADIDAALEVGLADVDLGALLVDLAETVDLSELLAEVELAEVLGAVLDGVDAEELAAWLREAADDATIGDLLGDVDVAELVALLTSGVDLDVELAAILGALLHELDVDLPTVGRDQLERVAEALAAGLVVAERLAEAVEAALDRLADAPEGIEELPLAELADLADGLADGLTAVAAALDGLADRLLDPVDDALDDAAGKVAEALAALDALEGELGEEHAEALARVRAAVEGTGAAVDAAAAGAALARQELDALTGRADELAAGAAGLAEALRDPDLVVDVALDPIVEALEHVAAKVDAVEGKLTAALAVVEEVLVDLDDDVGLEELVLEALGDRSVDLEPLLVEGAERLVAFLADVELAEVLEVVDLAGLLEALDLAAGVEELLADLTLADLVDWLDEAGVDLAELLADVDLAGLLAGVDAAELLAALEAAGADPAAFLDALGLEPADLLDAVDLAGLLADVDLADVLGAPLEALDVAELAAALADVDVDLAAALDAAGIDAADLLADVAVPDLAELVDLEELLAALGLDPAALLADLELPGLEALLDELDLDLAALLAEAGLEDLADLDVLLDGLLEALAALAEGGDDLAAGLADLAEEGLGRLVAQLDDDAADMRLELARLDALERRAAAAQPTLAPAGALASARYRLVLEPDEPAGPAAAALAAAVVLALGAEALRRRWGR